MKVIKTGGYGLLIHDWVPPTNTDHPTTLRSNSVHTNGPTGKRGEENSTEQQT